MENGKYTQEKVYAEFKRLLLFWLFLWTAIRSTPDDTSTLPVSTIPYRSKVTIATSTAIAANIGMVRASAPSLLAAAFGEGELEFERALGWEIFAADPVVLVFAG